MPVDIFTSRTPESVITALIQAGFPTCESGALISGHAVERYRGDPLSGGS
jgi:hypothetical protein